MNIWGEAAYNRMIELMQYLLMFPESKTASAVRKELEYLSYLQDHGACPGGYRQWESKATNE